MAKNIDSEMLLICPSLSLFCGNKPHPDWKNMIILLIDDNDHYGEILNKLNIMLLWKTFEDVVSHHYSLALFSSVSGPSYFSPENGHKNIRKGLPQITVQIISFDLGHP